MTETQTINLTPEHRTIVAKLRYMARQYTNGSYARGGSPSGKHYLDEAADAIEELAQRAAVPVGEVPDGWVESNTLPPDGTPVLLRWPDDNPEADVPWRYAVGRYQAKRSVHHWWSAESGLPRSFVVSPSHWRAI